MYLFTEEGEHEWYTRCLLCYVRSLRKGGMKGIHVLCSFTEEGECEWYTCGCCDVSIH